MILTIIDKYDLTVNFDFWNFVYRHILFPLSTQWDETNI